MNTNKKMGLLMTIEENALERLSELSPDTPEFNYTLNNIGLLLQVSEQVKYAEALWEGITAKEDELVLEKPDLPDIDITPPPDAEIPPQPKPVVMSTEPVSPKVTDVEPSMTLKDLRKRLILLHQQGLDLESLMKDMGYANLSSVPADRYSELLQKATVMVNGGTV